MRTLHRFLVWSAVLVGLLVGIARLTAIRWWTVPTNDPWLEASIAPTLRGGDVVLLWRMTDPAFGDLVVCPEPDAPERVVIGRIVGENDDTIRLDSGRLELNNRAVKTERNCNKHQFTVEHPDQGERIKQSCSIEDLEGVLHDRGDIGEHTFGTQREEFQVPLGEVFLASDNRLFPYDSRDYGTVPRNTCTEAVFFRLWSRKGYRDIETRFTYIR